jgi:hypothetical protein
MVAMAAAAHAGIRVSFMPAISFEIGYGKRPKWVILSHKRSDCQRLESVGKRTMCCPACSFSCSRWNQAILVRFSVKIGDLDRTL